MSFTIIDPDPINTLLLIFTLPLTIAPASFENYHQFLHHANNCSSVDYTIITYINVLMNNSSIHYNCSYTNFGTIRNDSFLK